MLFFCIYFAFLCCVHTVQCSGLAVYSILFYHYHYYYLGCRCWCRWCCWLSQLLLNILFSLENVDKQVSVASFLTHHLMWVCTPVHPVCVCVCHSDWVKLMRVTVCMRVGVYCVTLVLNRDGDGIRAKCLGTNFVRNLNLFAQIIISF